jgi:hypothetical protein
MTLTELLAAKQAKAEQGNWIPANNGTETPFLTRSGRRLLYCWQQSTGKHAYLNCDTDLIKTAL